MFMKRYLENSKKHIIDKMTIIFGRTKLGYILPIFAYIKVVPNLKNGLRFLGMIRKIPINNEFMKIPEIKAYPKIGILMMTKEGYIYGVNKMAMQNFAISINALLDNKTVDIKKSLHISTILPDFDLNNKEQINTIRSEKGLFLTLDSRSLKNAFEDFKEIIQEQKSEENKELFEIFHYMSKNLKQHKVICYMFDFVFNQGATFSSCG